MDRDDLELIVTCVPETDEQIDAFDAAFGRLCAQHTQARALVMVVTAATQAMIGSDDLIPR